MWYNYLSDYILKEIRKYLIYPCVLIKKSGSKFIIAAYADELNIIRTPEGRSRVLKEII